MDRRELVELVGSRLLAEAENRGVAHLLQWLARDAGIETIEGVMGVLAVDAPKDLAKIALEDPRPFPFAKERARRYRIRIGGKSKEELLKELKANGFCVREYAERMILSPEFQVQELEEDVDLICVAVGDLFGDSLRHTTTEIYARSQSLGLDLCSAEVGSHLSLQLDWQLIDEWLCVSIKQIADPDGRPNVFRVGRYGGVLLLSGRWARPGDEWSYDKWGPQDRFVFRLRK